MSLYLSRIELNPFSRRAIALASRPDDLHAVIYRMFDPADAGRILFRVEADARGPQVLIQAGASPNWERLGLEPSDLRGAPQTKPLDIEVSEGTELVFRLLARPTHKASTGKGNKSGPRRDLRTDEERLAWLNRKGESSGFRVTSCGLTMVSRPAIHPDKTPKQRGATFGAVQFDGVLVVTDREKLRLAISIGIGTQKAFGFGLLSLARG